MNLADAPDPYLALGLSKDATAAEIKTAYRKLVLTCHPDKIQDESKKAAATENFHKIQSAWEVLNDDEQRAKYDAMARLAAMQKDYAARQVPRASTFPTAYDVPLSTPRSSTFPTYSTRGPEPSYPTRGPEPNYPGRPDRYDSATGGDWFDPNIKFQDFVPSGYAEEERYFGSRPVNTDSRKSSYTEPKRHAHATRAEEPKKSYTTPKETEKAGRHDKKRNTDRDRRHDRDSKKTYQTTVADGSDSETETDTRRRRNEPRSAVPKSATRRTPSDGEHEDAHTRGLRQLREAAAHMEQYSEKAEKSYYVPLATPEPVRRSAAPSPVRHRHRNEHERERKASDPSHYGSSRRGESMSTKPSLDRTSSMPTDRTRSKHDDEKPPSLSRGATMPLPSRRPEAHRTESRLRYPADFDSDDAAPAPLPKRRDSASARPKVSRTTSYTIGRDGVTQAQRDTSPFTTDRRRSESPSPEKHRDKDKSRHKTSSSKHSSKPKLPRLHTTDFIAVTDDHITASPRASRPSAHRTDSMPLFAEVSYGSRRSHAERDRDRDDSCGHRSGEHRCCHHDDSYSELDRNHRNYDPEDREREARQYFGGIGDYQPPGVSVSHETVDFKPSRMETGRDSSSRSGSRRSSAKHVLPVHLKRMHTLSGRILS